MATLLSSKAVGSIIKIAVNGAARDFIIVQHGKPSSIYDDSFNNGVIVLMKDIYENRQWHSSDVNDYANSAIHSYLNSTFLNLIDAKIRDKIKQVKIPYRPGSGTSTTVNSGTNGLTCKIFLVSRVEWGQSITTNLYDGAKYAISAIDNVGTFWARTPQTGGSTNGWLGKAFGSMSSTGPVSSSGGIRPLLVLPSDMSVDDSGNIVTNQPPTAPNGITLPNTIFGGKSADIIWGAATDSDGSVGGYVLERAVNGGAFSQLYRGINRTYTDTITFGWNTIQHRVKAYDNDNAESGYTTSAVVTVLNNNNPVISDSNRDLGLKTTAFNTTYTVTNPDTGITKTLTVVEAIDGKQKRSFTATSGATNTFSVTAAEWIKLLNGLHSLTITATDNFGGSATRTFTFSKNETESEMTLSIPLAADAMVTKAIMSITRQIPTGAVFTVEVCNNAYDTTPTWEDVTQAVVSGSKFFFSNAVKTAEKWGFNIKIKVKRQSATGDCFIQGIGGNFE